MADHPESVLIVIVVVSSVVVMVIVVPIEFLTEMTCGAIVGGRSAEHCSQRACAISRSASSCCWKRARALRSAAFRTTQPWGERTHAAPIPPRVTLTPLTSQLAGAYGEHRMHSRR